MVSAIVIAALAFSGGPDALIKTVRDQLMQGMSRGQELYKLLGLQASAIPADTQATVVATMMRLLPAFTLILAGAAMLLNLRVFWRWAGPQRLTYSLFGDLSRWSASEWLVWLLLASGFGLFIPIGAVSDIALNGFICVAAIYFCQGLAIIGFYFHTLAVTGVLRGVIYFVGFAQPVVVGSVCVGGVCGMCVEFRAVEA